MKQTIGLYEFHRGFEDSRPNNFSFDGLEILFNYLAEIDESCGIETEFDVISICCDFSESDLDDINSSYGEEFEDLEEAEEWLNEQTSVCGCTSDTIIFQQF